MPKRRLTFADTDEAAEIFVWLWRAYANSPMTSADDEELRRASRLKDLRDAISVERDVPGAPPGSVFRGLTRDKGPQTMEMSVAEYDLLKRAIKAFAWPLVDADKAREIREFIDNAETVEDDGPAKSD
jgi:hypothetical protein